VCVKQDGEQVETVLYIILHISCMFCEYIVSAMYVLT
jgi:hypothetical protein